MNWKMTKYCTDSEYGTIDNETVFESEDDVANVKLGDGWIMPTIDEFQELFNNCSWEWTSMNGVNGYVPFPVMKHGRSRKIGYRKDLIAYKISLY